MAQAPFYARVATKLNGYIALAALLLIFDLVLATRLAVAWHTSHSDHSAQYAADQATYAGLQAQAGRLQSLPARLAASHRAATAFIADRIPANDSAVLSELGALTTRNHVRLSRAVYPVAPAIRGMAEFRIDANVTGEYTSVVHFINDLERDKTQAFFVIRSIELSGQQGGIVNLRIRITTFMHSDAANTAILEASRNSQAGGQQNEVQ